MRIFQPESKYVLKNITQGLAFLHENGILHRNLQPANILLTRHGKIKISNFGFSMQLKSACDTEPNRISSLCEWMAPEILLQEESGKQTHFTEQADIFSLGCVFYFVHSGGFHLFGTTNERRYFIAKNMPQWHNLDTGSSKEIISLLVSFDPEKRPSAIEILKQALYSFKTKPRNTCTLGIISNMECSETKIACQENTAEIQANNLISVDKNSLVLKTPSGVKIYKGKFDGRSVMVKVVENDNEIALKEVKFLKLLDGHENIVRYFMAEQNEDEIFIALEPCLINLEEEIERKLIQPEPNFVNKSCASGLAFLHKNKITHGDLKPSNILLNKYGDVKISNFGSSVHNQNLETSPLVSQNSLEDADKYVESKEQKADSKNRNREAEKADIKSLGCLFFFVLSDGEHLYKTSHGQLPDSDKLENSNTLDWGDVPLDDSTKELITKMVSDSSDEQLSAEEVERFELFKSVHKHDPWKRYETHEKMPSQSGLTESKPNLIESKEDLVNAVIKRWPTSQYNVKRIKRDINAVCNLDGETLIHYAAATIDSVQCLASLVELGCDWKAKTISGETVLHWAVRFGNVEAIKYFVSLGADIEAKDQNYRTPIHYLFADSFKPYDIHGGLKNVLETLCTLTDFGADVNALDRLQQNLLHFAVHRRSTEELKRIVELGGNWRAVNKFGKTVVHFAASHGNIDAINYFVSLGANINPRDSEGKTPLHCINLFKNAIPMLHVLVENGADINAIDRNGKSLLRLAKSRKTPSEINTEIIKLGGK